jgi:hypothetical protein
MPGDEEPKQRRHRPVAIPLIIAFVVWLILLLLYAFPELGTKTNLSFELWLNIGNLVLAGMIFWAALSRFTFAPVEEAEEPSAKAEGEEAPIEAEAMAEPSGKDGTVADRPKPRAAPNAAAERVKAAAERAKGVTVAPAEGAEAAVAQRPPAGEEGVRVVEWPPKKPGGVYSDTLVQVDYDLVLNMRTELGRVCGNCEGLPECKKRVGGRLPDDVFEWNFECKEGLKHELAKVRRARQAEAMAKAVAPPPEVAQAVEARIVEAVPVPEPKGEPKVEPGPAAKATPESAATSSVMEAKAEPAPQEPTYSAPPAYKVEAAAPPVKESAGAPATPVPAPGAGPAPAPVPPAPAAPEAADEELELGPEDAAVETEQPAPAPPKAEGKPKLRKKLLKRKD